MHPHAAPHFTRQLFVGELYLDKHLANRHAGVMTPGAGVCLADHCDVLHCAAAMRSPAARRRAACTSASAAELRHRCEALADGCFPRSGGSLEGVNGSAMLAPDEAAKAAALHELFHSQFCAAHACDHDRPKPFGRGRQVDSAMRALTISLSIIAAVGLGLYYALVALNWAKPPATRPDLRRAVPGHSSSASRPAARSGLWPWGKATKEKVY